MHIGSKKGAISSRWTKAFPIDRNLFGDGRICFAREKKTTLPVIGFICFNILHYLSVKQFAPFSLRTFSTEIDTIEFIGIWKTFKWFFEMVKTGKIPIHFLNRIKSTFTLWECWTQMRLDFSIWKLFCT